MEARAVGKYIRISPQKARLVADVVRGMDVDRAITTLRFMPKKGAMILRKVIESAVANATQDDQVDVDNLFIKKIHIDGGPSLKRIRPRAQGRATRIIKRTSHITVILDEVE
ncbi:MAG: 50S ribosomal protein L22 [Desulfopila sp.]